MLLQSKLLPLHVQNFALELLSFRQLPVNDNISQLLPNLIKKEESLKFFIAFL